MIATAEQFERHNTGIDGLMKYFSVISTYGIEEYLAEVEKYPILSEEEEQTLAEQVYDHDDEAALEKLVLSNLRLVARVALECCDDAPPGGFEFNRISALYSWSTGAPPPPKALSYRRALPAVAGA